MARGIAGTSRVVDPMRYHKALARFLEENADEPYRDDWAPAWALRSRDEGGDKYEVAAKDHHLAIMVWKAVHEERGLGTEELAKIGAHFVGRLMGIHTRWCRCPAARAIRSERSRAANAKRRGEVSDTGEVLPYGLRREIPKES